MIQSEKELQHSISALARMYSLAERERGEARWEADTRAEIVESTEAMLGMVEREVAEYLARKYGLVTERAEPAEIAA